MLVSPYGSWASPITSDLIAAEAIRLDQIALDGDAIFWTESQPQKQGRTFLYRSVGGGEPEPVTPDDEESLQRPHARPRIRRRRLRGRRGAVIFSNFADQRLYRQDFGQQPRPITPLPASGPADALRYADGVIRPAPRPDDLRPGRPHRGRRGGQRARRRRSCGRRGATSPRLGERLLFDAAPQPGWRAPRLARPGIIRTCRGSRPSSGSARFFLTARSAPRAGSRADRTNRSSSRNGRRTAISSSSPTEAAGGTSIARGTAQSSRWRRWRPNSRGRNGCSACPLTPSSWPSA